MSKVSVRQSKLRSLRFPADLDDRITELSVKRHVPRSTWILLACQEYADPKCKKDLIDG